MYPLGLDSQIWPFTVVTLLSVSCAILNRNSFAV